MVVGEYLKQPTAGDFLGGVGRSGAKPELARACVRVCDIDSSECSCKFSNRTVLKVMLRSGHGGEEGGDGGRVVIDQARMPPLRATRSRSFSSVKAAKGSGNNRVPDLSSRIAVQTFAAF